MTEVELLYFDGCPSWRQAWRELADALADVGGDATVRLRNVSGLSDAELQGFAGSPTIRVQGRDVEGYSGPGVLACRRYFSTGGRGWPSPALLRSRIEEAAAGELG